MKKQYYIAPRACTEALLNDSELLTASQTYGGELGSREINLPTEIDTEIQTLINNL